MGLPQASKGIVADRLPIGSGRFVEAFKTQQLESCSRGQADGAPAPAAACAPPYVPLRGPLHHVPFGGRSINKLLLSRRMDDSVMAAAS
jgi:hypothetical protein